MNWARSMLLALCMASAVFAACSSSGENRVSFPAVVTLGDCDVCPHINNDALAMGDNRVSFTLTDQDDNLVLDAHLHVAFYNLASADPKLTSEEDARFIPVTLSYVDSQSGNQETTTGESGAYVVHATFDRAGDWGAWLTITRGGKTLSPLPYRFNVLDHTSEPEIGDAAPASEQQTLATASSIADIDSSSPPRPAMHEITVAAALKTGRPIVVAFATPAFCQSRTCAPVMDTVMDPLSAAYGDNAIFVHIEPYELAPLRQSNVFQTVRVMREWNLSSEPWVFVIDREGRVAGKFQGIVAADEVETVLKQALGTPASATPAGG